MVSTAGRAPAIPPRAPLVTVVIPTFNWSAVLRYSIHSALWQTYSNVEVLVVGDGCTDDSEQVVGSFADSRVRVGALPSSEAGDSVWVSTS
jgi:glycosyltransferase involved in cell wall biosynthesis